MNWLQGFPYCLTQPCIHGDVGASVLTVSSYCSSWEQFRWLRVRETWPYWSHTAWRRYTGRERRERTGCGEKNLRIRICCAQETHDPHIYHIISVSDCVCCYLVIHDCSQAHDAHMHVVFLAHEAGVLDGFAVGNCAIAANGWQKLIFCNQTF